MQRVKKKRQMNFYNIPDFSGAALGAISLELDGGGNALASARDILATIYFVHRQHLPPMSPPYQGRDAAVPCTLPRQN